MNDEQNPPAEVVSITRKRGRRPSRRPNGPHPQKEKEALMTALQLHGGSVDDLIKTRPDLASMRRSLYHWKAEGLKPSPEMTAYVADLLDSITLQCLSLLPSKLPDASVRDIVGAMHISIDKALLLRGQATSITANIDLRKEVADVLGVTIDVLPE